MQYYSAIKFKLLVYAFLNSWETLNFSSLALARLSLESRSLQLLCAFLLLSQQKNESKQPIGFYCTTGPVYSLRHVSFKFTIESLHLIYIISNTAFCKLGSAYSHRHTVLLALYKYRTARVYVRVGEIAPCWHSEASLAHCCWGPVLWPSLCSTAMGSGPSRP